MLKLGYILTQQGLLTDDQLKTALELHKMTGKKLEIGRASCRERV